MLNERKLTKSELAKREDIIMKMKKNKRELVKRYGKDAEKVMYGRATQLAKKQAESMDQDKIKELVKDALQNPKKADLNKDGKLSDYEKKRGAAIEKSMSVDEIDNSEYAMAVRASKAYKPGPKPSPKRHPKPKNARDLERYPDPTEKAASAKIGAGGEFTDDDAAAVADKMPKIGKDKEFTLTREDLDLGHQDNEPHMLKADLYRIGKYAMELYQMVDRFEEGSEEVDFPHWWQSKVIKAKDMLVSAKHYLDFEIKEPQIDAMVDVAQEEDVIDEAKYTDYSNNELAAYCKNNPEDKAAAAELKKRSQKLKDLSRTDIKEGVWSLGSANEIKDAIHTLEMWYELDAREISALFDDRDNSNFFYNVVGDDLFHDALDRAEREAAANSTDRAHNAVTDAIGRAEELLAVVRERESSRPYKTDIFNEVANKLAKQLKSK